MQWQRRQGHGNYVHDGVDGADDDDGNGNRLPRCGLKTQFNQCDIVDTGKEQHTLHVCAHTLNILCRTSSN